MNDVCFVDSRNRSWAPRITGRVIRDFEARSGGGLFEKAHAAILRTRDGEQPLLFLVEVAQELMKTSGNILFLIYEGCRPNDDPRCVPYRESRKDKEVQVTFDDFCGAIDEKDIIDASVVALLALFEYFPEPEKKTEWEIYDDQETGKGTPYSWSSVFEYAAIARADPMRHSLRELKQMSDIIDDQNWNYIAWNCYWMPRYTKRGTHLSVDDFHPHRGKNNKVQISKFNKWMSWASEKAGLPKSISKEDFERKWQEYLKCQEKSQQAKQ